jgi:hypothetical protein
MYQQVLGLVDGQSKRSALAIGLSSATPSELSIEQSSLGEATRRPLCWQGQAHSSLEFSEPGKSTRLVSLEIVWIS